MIGPVFIHTETHYTYPDTTKPLPTSNVLRQVKDT